MSPLLWGKQIKQIRASHHVKSSEKMSLVLWEHMDGLPGLSPIYWLAPPTVSDSVVLDTHAHLSGSNLDVSSLEKFNAALGT